MKVLTFAHGGTLNIISALTRLSPVHKLCFYFFVGLFACGVLRCNKQVACTLVSWSCCKSLLLTSVRHRNLWQANLCLRQEHHGVFNGCVCVLIMQTAGRPQKWMFLLHIWQYALSNYSLLMFCHLCLVMFVSPYIHKNCNTFAAFHPWCFVQKSCLLYGPFNVVHSVRALIQLSEDALGQGALDCFLWIPCEPLTRYLKFGIQELKIFSRQPYFHIWVSFMSD